MHPTPVNCVISHSMNSFTATQTSVQVNWSDRRKTKQSTNHTKDLFKLDLLLTQACKPYVFKFTSDGCVHMWCVRVCVAGGGGLKQRWKRWTDKQTSL